MNRLFTIPLFLGVFLFCFSAKAQQDYSVHFSQGTEAFSENSSIEGFKKPLKSEIFNGTYLRYLQFNTLLSKQEKEKLEQSGLHFLQYVTYGAYLTAIPSTYDLRTLTNLRSIQNVQSKWKIHKSLLKEPFGAWATLGDQLDIIIQVYEVADLEVCSELIKEQGYKILFKGQQNHWMKVRIPKTDIQKVADLAYVGHIELQPAPGEPEDTRGRALHRSNLVNSAAPMGPKYDGTGIGVLVRDDGYLGPHIDFHGRLTDLATDNSTVEHADGVAGILTGSGNLDPYMKGMASGASIFNIIYTPEFEDMTLPLHLNNGVKVTNSSYSNGCNDGYTVTTQTVDKQIFENPTLMHVFSAGNSNGLNCDYGAGSQWGNITGGHKQGKNCIATANLGQDFVLENSSSRGPAHDGRLKPDISANGYGHYSTEPDNTYSEFGGTSAASPGIAGCTAQLMHAHHDLFGTEAPSALIKAVLLNAANDLGNVGPDYKYGWGHVNAYRSLQILEKNNFWSAQIAQDSVYTQTIEIPAGMTEARIMLYWPEKEAAENAARALINDLDLTVLSPDSTILKPWLLNPTPNAATLDAPATHGRDSLNNVEQVAIFNPTAGTYTIQVKGYEVPLGTQLFYIVYEDRNTKPKVVYPNGGESLMPRDTVRIHWDSDPSYAGVTTLGYSKDNGATWVNIGTSIANRRYFDWPVPNIVSKDVLVQVITGQFSDTSDVTFNIVTRPDSVEIYRVCPDSMFVRFRPKNDTLSHDIYLLGSKYMEIKATVPTGQKTYGFPISNQGGDHWVAVRASHSNGLYSERTIAVKGGSGLVNCPQAYDLQQTSILAPTKTNFTSCAPINELIKVGIRNRGLNPVSGATISYKLGTAAVVTEPLITLGVDSFTIHTFADAIHLDTIGTLDFKTWISFSQDNYHTNDSLSSKWSISTRTVNQLFTEDFEASNISFPVLGWSISNPDDGITWKAATVTGIDDQPTQTVWMDYFSYSPSNAQEDALNMIPVDLTGFATPALRFDLAYTTYDGAGYADGLRIEAYPACDLTATPVVLYEKFYPELATAAPVTVEWVPADGSEWRTETVSMLGLTGPTLIRFIGINDFGNSLYLDNIGLANVAIAPTVANFELSKDTICKAEAFTVTNQSTGDQLTYNWNFGLGANPQSATTAGPHTVRYLTSFGDKTIRLILTGAGGTDTITQQVFAFNTPTANFSSIITNDSVQFANTSSYGETYLWDFGDGMTSTAVNPLHIYGANGTYSVTLSTTNRCGANLRTRDVVVMTSGLETLPLGYSLKAGPNPNKGQFSVTIQSPVHESINLNLHDMAGRLITTRTVQSSANAEVISTFENLGLAKGSYLLRVRTEAGENVFKIVVQ